MDIRHLPIPPSSGGAISPGGRKPYDQRRQMRPTRATRSPSLRQRGGIPGSGWCHQVWSLPERAGQGGSHARDGRLWGCDGDDGSGWGTRDFEKNNGVGSTFMWVNCYDVWEASSRSQLHQCGVELISGKTGQLAEGG